MLLVAKMVGQLGMHRTLYKSTRQLLQQALFADQVLRSLVIRKQLVDDSFVDSHTSLLVLRNLHLHKILNTLDTSGRNPSKPEALRYCSISGISNTWRLCSLRYHSRTPRNFKMPALPAVNVNTESTAPGFIRSEEHTSELQSPCNLVC